MKNYDRIKFWHEFAFVITMLIYEYLVICCRENQAVPSHTHGLVASSNFLQSGSSFLEESHKVMLRILHNEAFCPYISIVVATIVHSTPTGSI